MGAHTYTIHQYPKSTRTHLKIVATSIWQQPTQDFTCSMISLALNRVLPRSMHFYLFKTGQYIESYAQKQKSKKEILPWLNDILETQKYPEAPAEIPTHRVELR